MQNQPRLIEVRMGNLVFINNQSVLTTFDRATQKFDLCLTFVTPEDRFIMAMSTCAGIFVRNVADNPEIPFALAHMPSAEKARRTNGGMTYEQVRAHMNEPEVQASIKALLKDIGKLAPAAADELCASLYSPIFGPDLLAERVMESMGSEIEVYIFGGMSEKGKRIPDVVGSIEEEFKRRGVKTVIEHSVLDLTQFDRVAMISPYATDATDYVRPGRKVSQPYMTIQLTASDSEG